MTLVTEPKSKILKYFESQSSRVLSIFMDKLVADAQRFDILKGAGGAIYG